MRPAISPIRYVVDRVAVSESGCWMWRGTVRSGYGVAKIGGRRWSAHRLAFILLRGEIADGLELDHLCRTQLCVNPWHLEPVPHVVNLYRGTGWSGRNSRKTHCPNGHPYDRVEIIRGRPGRRCSACRRVYQKLRNQAYRQRKAAAA